MNVSVQIWRFHLTLHFWFTRQGRARGPAPSRKREDRREVTMAAPKERVSDEDRRPKEAGMKCRRGKVKPAVMTISLAYLAFARLRASLFMVAPPLAMQMMRNRTKKNATPRTNLTASTICASFFVKIGSKGAARRRHPVVT